MGSVSVRKRGSKADPGCAGSSPSGAGGRHRAGVSTVPEEAGLRTADEGDAETRASPQAQGKVLEHPGPAFVREVIHQVREGKHGARSTKQAIAIRLSEARRADVKLGVPGRAAASTKESARRAAAHAGKKPLGRRTPRGAARAQARGTACRVASRARTAGEARRVPPKHRRAPACGAEGGPHQKSGGPQGRCPQGRPHLPVAARRSWVCRIWSSRVPSRGGRDASEPEGIRFRDALELLCGDRFDGARLI
jgi:hypothetical protein